MHRTLASFAALVVFAAAPAHAQQSASPEKLIALAESAGISDIAANATILDMDGKVLREGTNGWTCLAHPEAPMCGDEQWASWMDAYVNKKDDVNVTAVGISYMLKGDQGVSNVDPFAQKPTPDNEWVVTGPHLMIIVPDPDLLAGIPTDPSGGGPYVMWRDTPFVHVMIPVESGVVHMPHQGGS